METWQDVYKYMKSKKNPCALSSSEFRNLTKRMTKIIFEKGKRAGLRQTKEDTKKAA